MNPDQPLLDGLAGKVDAALQQALGGAKRVALLNFPNHDNPGDSALWLGARASLRRSGVKVAYSAAWDTLSPAALRSAVPDGPVLLNGGGNFGDLYAGQQKVRERVFAEFTERPIIQLPQSIHFRDPANLDRNRALVAAHGRVTIMAREQDSFDLAADVFDARTLLAPDAAFGLGSLPGPTGSPVADLLWLIRPDSDVESGGHGGPPEGIDARWQEWVGPQPEEPVWLRGHDRALRINRRLRPKLAADERWARFAWRPLAATFPPLAAGWTRRGVEILGRGRVVVVDRLHAHILALLAGLPHVVLDNNYGKVSGTHRAWTHPSTLARWADNGDEARSAAMELVKGLPGR